LGGVRGEMEREREKRGHVLFSFSSLSSLSFLPHFSRVPGATIRCPLSLSHTHTHGSF